MNYKEKYEKALERAKVYHTGGSISDAHITEIIFPELKESEDDRIVRCLLNYFNHVRYNGLDLKGTDVDEVIAWLEKQGEKVTNINGEDYGIDGLYHAIKILERTVGRVTGYQSDDGILEHKAAISAVKELYEKQGEKKPTDKIEPKFKVGDWVVNNTTLNLCHILKVEHGQYICDDCSFPITKESEYHIWTIEDAKDGDVLAAQECYVIFKEIDGLNIKCYCTYHYMSNPSFHVDTLQNKAAFHPATKEQRDTLMKAMANAGYTCDFEKKESKKIEPKTLDADKVIAWLVANICDFEYYVTRFKKDFGL